MEFFTLDVALDIIERALEGKADLGRQMEGSLPKVDNVLDFPLHMPSPDSPEAALSCNDTITTAKNFKHARISLHRQAEGWCSGNDALDKPKKIRRAAKFRTIDVENIMWFPKILNAAHKELCPHQEHSAPPSMLDLTKLSAVSDLIKVVYHEFQNNVAPTIPLSEEVRGR